MVSSRLSASLCLFTISLSAAGLPCLTAVAQEVRRPKRLIATGWDKPDTRRLRENLDLIESRPFDGVVFEAVGRDEEGRPVPLQWAFQNTPWKQTWFQQAIDDLKGCPFNRLTDNFLQLNANPGNVDWFDDDGWTAIVDHWRIAARIASQSGCKGILFDPEPYSAPHAPFRYDAQPDRDRHSFEEYAAKARQRGRQVMEAVADEYSTITLFCYFMNSVNASATERDDPHRVLARSGYGLYPAFIDGWLDAAAPSITFVDGCESAYLFNGPPQYLEAAVRIKGACQELVSPENRARYRAQVQVGFGVYLDAYWNEPDSQWGRWYVDGLGGPRVDRLRANVQTALRLADRYVWVYGEKFRWWPTPNGRVNQETWPEALPGCGDAIRYARDPVDYARAAIGQFRQPGQPANLARNGDFEADSTVDENGRRHTFRRGGPPAGWSAWQDSDSKGTFTWDEGERQGEGSARASGAAQGCFLQSIPVEPYERYVVGAACRACGQGQAWLRVRWQTSEGAWTAEARDRIDFADPAIDRPTELLAVVEVPEGAGRLAVLLGVDGQRGPDDAAWFDDVVLYRLP